MKDMMDTTRCQECLSDRILVLSDESDRSGICIDCKNLIPPPIFGGISYHEFERIRSGQEPEMIEDQKPATARPDPVRELVDKLVREKVVPKVVETIPEPADRKPGLLTRLKGKLASWWSRHRQKRKDPVKTGNPQVGETWKVGPCLLCGTAYRVTGTVVTEKEFHRANPAHGGKHRFVFLKAKNGIGSGWYYGCMLCAKKA